MSRASIKALIINLLLAALTSIIWIRSKNLTLIDAIICFVVVFFVLFSVDTFASWAKYKAAKKQRDADQSQ